MGSQVTIKTQKIVEKFNLLFFSYLLLSSLSAMSQEHDRHAFAKIHPGMAQYEVLAIIQNPQDKEEMEALREEVWRFREGEIRFRDGKVSRSYPRQVPFSSGMASAPLSHDGQIVPYDSREEGLIEPGQGGGWASPVPLSLSENEAPSDLSGIMKEVQKLSEPESPPQGGSYNGAMPPPYVQDPIPPPS
jgi:hypothetical protein